MPATRGGRALTVREAAQRVQRAEETIRRWIWTGKLPARKLGTSYQVDEKDLEAVAAGAVLPAPRQSDERHLGLSEWVADVKAWRAEVDVPPASGAGHLVIEDRRERSVRGDR
jgi:excisionase family DNA binding protein